MKQLQILFLMLFVLFSCKEENVPQEFSVNINECNMTSKGGNFTFSVQSNYSWSATSNDEWISVESENTFVKVNIAPNTNSKNRNGEIVIRSGKLTHSVIVVQEAKTEIIIGEKEFKLSDDGDILTIDLNVNKEFGIKITEEWIQQLGLNDNACSLAINANDAYEDRIGYVIFETVDLADTITIWQCQKDGLILTSKNVTVHENGEQISFEVKANIDYSYQINEGSDWISEEKARSLVSHYHAFTIAPNSTKKDRIAEITFQSTAKGIKEVLTITQAGQKSILKIVHSNEIWDIPIFRGSNVIGNVDWGDNSETDEYSEYLTHQYESSKERNVTVSVRNAESVKLENLIKVSSIDLSAF